MNPGCLKWNIFTSAMYAAGACALTEAVAQQPALPNSVPIEFSAPRSNSVISNLSAVISEQESRGEFNGLLMNTKPDSSEAGPSQMPMVITPPRPAVRSRQIRNLMNKDWVFNSPEESEFGLTAAQIFKIPDAKDERSKTEEMTPLERFFSSGSGRRETTADQPDKSSGEISGYSTSRDTAWPALSGPATARDPGVRQFFQNDAALTAQTLPWAVYGAGSWEADKAATDRERTRKMHMETFKETLEWRPAGASPAGSPGDSGNWLNPVATWGVSPSITPSPLAIPFNAAGASAEPKRQNPFGTLPGDFASPSLTPGLPEFSSTPALPASLTPTLPVLEQPQRRTMPQPVFEMPKSRF